MAFAIAVWLIGAGPASAQFMKDSYYFMADDGKQSPEEMEEEAMFVYQNCQSNPYQAEYYDCQCIAGAFLNEREKIGPLKPQDQIVYELFRGGPKDCANKTEIAGSSYTDCMAYAEAFREFEKDNEEYCSCVGKTVARDFSKNPYLRTTYIEDLRVDALVDCEERNEDGDPVR